VSSKTKDIARINEIIKSSPDFRTEKVERLKNEIASGKYFVAGEEIAVKF
jgi:flagellar biosynthesis anti-sigma factor FlgM